MCSRGCSHFLLRTVQLNCPNCSLKHCRRQKKETRFFQPGSAALKAASTLPPTGTAIIAGWLTWAGGVLDVYGGQPSAQLIADTIPAPAETLRRHLAGDDVPPEARVEAEAALAAVTEARKRWLHSVGR